jgi:hypothetical protein
VSRALILLAIGCAAPGTRPLANHHAPASVELAWRAVADDRDWVHVTLVVDGAPYEVGTASGPDDEGSAPSGCKSEPDRADPAVQTFVCSLASRWYTASLQGGELVVTRFDEWFQPHRLTNTVVKRIKVRGTTLHVLPYRAS